VSSRNGGSRRPRFSVMPPVTVVDISSVLCFLQIMETVAVITVRSVLIYTEARIDSLLCRTHSHFSLKLFRI
jgi:hypothetical protein